MRVLADENISRAIVMAVEGLGHDVVWVARDDPGIPDSEVVDLALTRADLLVTFDKNLAATVARRKTCGVVLLRLSAAPPEQVAAIVSQLVQSRKGLANAYAVVSESGIRFRPY